MNRYRTLLLFLLAALLAMPAAAQTTQAQKSTARESVRERAIKRCKENRGVDCESKEGLAEWLRQEQPVSESARQAAAAKRHREECARTKGGPAC